MKPQCSSKSKKHEWVSVLISALTYALRNSATKFLLAKVATFTLVGPVKAWVITFTTEYLFDHLIIPLFTELELEGKYRIDQVDGKKRIKLLNEAIENEDETAVNDYIDSL